MSDHTSSSKSLLLPVLIAFVVPLVVLVAFFVLSALLGSSGSSAPAGTADQELALRIQKVGTVALVAASGEPKTGEEVFKARCSACHATGALASPKFQDAAAWAPRIKLGFEALLTSALKGKNAMPAQGGSDLSDYEIARGVVYMTNAAGAKFDEPKAPAK